MMDLIVKIMVEVLGILVVIPDSLELLVILLFNSFSMYSQGTTMGFYCSILCRKNVTTVAVFLFLGVEMARANRWNDYRNQRY